MSSTSAPYHVHVYYDEESRPCAARLRQEILSRKETQDLANVEFVGAMRDENVGPHPKPQFEVHFLEASLPAVLALVEASGLTALVHPLTDDDLADHTTLAHWVGEPLPLDRSVLDPPGVNQGIPRFGKSDV